MIRKFVLAFLLLFFSSVSLAAFQFYQTVDEALLQCNADMTAYLGGAVNTPNAHYTCQPSVYEFSGVKVHDVTLTFYGLSSSTLMSFYSTCPSPLVLGQNPSIFNGYSFSNSCTAPPVCTAPKILSVERDSCIEKSQCLLPLNVVNSTQTACIAVPNCTAPQVLNAELNTCIAPPNPNYKKWFKSKSLAASACSADQYDSKFLALIPDGSTDFLMCPESSTDVKLKKGVDVSTAEIINEYTVCEFPKKITDVASGGYVNSCGEPPPTDKKTSCPAGERLIQGHCYIVVDVPTDVGGTRIPDGSFSCPDGTVIRPPMTCLTTDIGGTSGAGGGTSGTGSTGGTGTGSTGTGSTGVPIPDGSFACPDGSIIRPPLVCKSDIGIPPDPTVTPPADTVPAPADTTGKQCGYFNGERRCYDPLWTINVPPPDTGTTGTGTTGTGTGTTGTGSTGSTGTGDTGTGTTGGSGTTGTGSTGSTSTGDTGTGTTGTGSTGTGTGSTGTGTGSGGLITCDGGIPVGPNGSCSSGGTGTGTTGTGSGTDTGTGTGSTGTGSTSTGGTGSIGTGTGTTGTGSGTGSTGTGTGNTGTQPSDGGNCSDLTGAVNCLKGQGTKKTVKTGDKGGFGTAADTALTQAKTDLNNKMAEVKSGLKAFKPSLSGGVGVLPVFKFGSYKGNDLEVDLNDYSGSLSIFSSVIIFVATVIAFRIVLGSGG